MTGPGEKLLLAGVVVVLLAALVAAVTILDSPAEERRQRLDHQRSADLDELADAIDEHWDHEGSLPADLDALTRWEHRSEPRRDPATGEPYRYRPTGAASFELCATFATEQPGDEDRWRPRRPRRVLWQHPAGEHCVELEAQERPG